MWSNPHRCGVRRTRNHRRVARFPISSCSGLGLPCPLNRSSGGGLLPHLFTLTPRKERFIFCGTGRELTFTQAPPVFTGNPTLWCPDFPLAGKLASKRMTASRKILKVKKYSEDLKIRDECTSPVADLPLHIDNSSALITLGDLFFNKHGRDHIIGYP